MEREHTGRSGAGIRTIVRAATPERLVRNRRRHTGYRAGAWLLVLVGMLPHSVAGTPALAQMLPDGAGPLVAERSEVGATCADGAVNGLVTVSIAAVTAVFSELILPAYPVLLGIGLGVGCSARLVGEGIRERGYELWQAYGPSLN